MIPTPNLRFIERKYKVPECTDLLGFPAFTTRRVLQQYWARMHTTGPGPDGEWRDVPLEDAS